MHPIEAGAGVALILLALAWQRYPQARRGRLQRSGGDVASFDRRMESGAAKLLPGLALVLGVSLVVWGVTGG